MRDKDFERFVRKMGEATYHEQVPGETLERYRGVLPDKLLEYWQDEGWCGYGHGRLWFVNPDAYADIVRMWLEGTVFEQIDRYHAILRTGFGKLFLWGETKNQPFMINCPEHAIIAEESRLRRRDDDADFALRVFIGSKKERQTDCKDDNGEPLFERARDTLGELGPDEVYGFEPALVMGGEARLENLQRMKAHQHLMILRQLAAPRVPFSGVNLDYQE